MLGIGFWEMVVIAAIALVVIGPERFPEFAKILLRTFRDLRGYVNDVKEDITKELRPVQREIEDLRRYQPEDYLDALTQEDADDQKTTSDPAKPTSPEPPPPNSVPKDDPEDITDTPQERR